MLETSPRKLQEAKLVEVERDDVSGLLSSKWHPVYDGDEQSLSEDKRNEEVEERYFLTHSVNEELEEANRNRALFGSPENRMQKKFFCFDEGE